MDVNSISAASQLNTRTTAKATQENQFSSDMFYKLYRLFKFNRVGGLAMDVNSISAASQLNTRTTAKATQENQFSSDMFYKLLAAQIQYQDPMESMDNTQMILQMAQFSTIEQLNNLNQQFAVFMEMSTVQDGAALVGKEVRIGLDDETTIVGVVNKVGFSSSGTLC